MFHGGRVPSLFYLPLKRNFEQWHILGVFNWDDCYRDYQVSLKTFAGADVWRAFEFWSETYLGSSENSVVRVRNVPAHGCKLIALRRALDHPQLVGTNLHVFQGAVDIQEVAYANRQLRIVVNHFYQRERSMFIHCPRRYVLAKLRTNAKDYLLDDRLAPLVRIRFNGRKRTEFNLTWRT